MKQWRAWKVTAVALAMALLLPIASLAAPGELDPRFGAAGIAALGGVSGNWNALARQADGKLVAAGSAAIGAGTDFSLARYNANGTLDASFGTGGRVLTSFANEGDHRAHAVAIQADGKIIAAGQRDSGTSRDFALIRYSAGGLIDTSFGTSGVVFSRLTPSGDNIAYAIAIQADGKIVAAGHATNGSVSFFVVVRYLANGTLDSTFGTAGQAQVFSNISAAARAVAIQADGKIVAVGSENGLSVGSTFVVARLNANGTADSSFGGVGGTLTSHFGANTADFGTAVAIQPDGKILAGGTTGQVFFPLQFVVVRYNANGTRDSTFGTVSGAAFSSFAGLSTGLSSLAIQADGKVLAAGAAQGATDVGVTLARFNADGTPDAGFGTSGQAYRAIGSTGGAISAIALQSSGLAVVAGGADGTPLLAGAQLEKLDSSTSLSVLPVATTHFGVPVTMSGTVTGPLQVPTGTVAIVDNGTTIGTVSVGPGGQYTFTTSSLTVGSHTIKANYAGDTTYKTSGASGVDHAVDSAAVPAIALVSSVNPSAFLQIVTFTATVSGGAGFPTGTVTFMNGSTVLGGDTLDKGVATLATNNFSTGTYAITAVYSGSATYNGTTSAPLSQVVKPASTTTLVFNPASSTCGQQSTATATVSGTAGPRTGQVTFRAMNGSVQSVATLNASGTASMVLGFAASGDSGLTAEYAGDATYAPSNSGFVAITVAQSTPIVTLTSTPGPVVAGTSVTFTATVPQVGLCFAPNGAVVFKDGAVTLGQGFLFTGTATFSTNTLTAGLHSITAQYTGNAFNGPATSTALPFTVTPMMFTLTVSRTGAGRGKVLSAPAGIACGVQCTGDFANGTSIVLTATPEGGSTVGAWTGCDSTAGNQCTIAIAGARSASVSFGVDPLGDSDGDGIPNAVEPVEGRDLYVKDNDVFANPRLFAMQQYRDFLGREGDAAGIQFYIDLLNAGTLVRANVIENFFNSPEFQGVGSPVARLYFATFLRIPDYDGLIFQINAFRSGAPLAVIANNFTLSPEFTARYGAINNTQYVTLLYQNILGRTPVQAEIDFHVGRLNGGFTRGDILVGFSESPEYQANTAHDVYVTMMYVGMLRRAPEQGGFDFWVDYMDAGNSGLALILGFLQSPEYHNRFLP